jgi:hypothetical protein
MRILRAWVFVPILLLLAALFASPAWADAYTDQVAAKFNAQTHVVADPAAKPPLQNPDKINRQIVTSRWSWSSSPPVWVAAVAPNQTGVTTPDAIHNVALARNPKFSGVILVIDSKGYHVRAYNVPQAVANNVDGFMGQSAKANRNNPYGATSAFISKLSGMNISGGPVGTSPNSNHKATSWTWVWVLLIVIAALALAALLAYFVIRRLRRSREQESAREAVKSSLIDAESGVNDLSFEMLAGDTPDVSSEYNRSSSSLADAKAAFRSGDYTSAKAHIRAANETVAKGRRKLNPTRLQTPLAFAPEARNMPTSGWNPEKPDVEAVKAVPKTGRKKATVKAKNPQGQTVTINNNNYSTQQRSGYDHYYGGGMYNGAYFYPGYYPYSFWSPGWSFTDVLLMDALLDDHWGGNYTGFDGGYDSQQADTGFDGGGTNDYDSQQTDVGFDGTDESSGGGDTGFDGSQDDGGDVDFGGDDSSSPDSSGSDYSYSGSSDSGSSWDSGGSSDYGSSDSGGSSFDSGGGGFDSGGGFDGGGDSGF